MKIDGKVIPSGGSLFEHWRQDYDDDETSIGRLEPFQLELGISDKGFGIGTDMEGIHHKLWEESPLTYPGEDRVDEAFVYAVLAYLSYIEFEHVGYVRVTETERSRDGTRNWNIQGYALTEVM